MVADTDADLGLHEFGAAFDFDGLGQAADLERDLRQVRGRGRPRVSRR